jgi:hypothetical protein
MQQCECSATRKSTSVCKGALIAGPRRRIDALVRRAQAAKSPFAAHIKPLDITSHDQALMDPLSDPVHTSPAKLNCRMNIHTHVCMCLSMIKVVFGAKR